MMSSSQSDSIYVVKSTKLSSITKSVINPKKSIAEDDKLFFLLNVYYLIWKYKNWKQKIPKVTPYYANKCNDNELVLRML